MKELRRAHRIAEIRHERAVRLACGGPDVLEKEEELLEELAALEQGFGREHEFHLSREAVLQGEKLSGRR